MVLTTGSSRPTRSSLGGSQAGGLASFGRLPLRVFAILWHLCLTLCLYSDTICMSDLCIRASVPLVCIM